MHDVATGRDERETNDPRRVPLEQALEKAYVPAIPAAVAPAGLATPAVRSARVAAIAPARPTATPAVRAAAPTARPPTAPPPIAAPAAPSAAVRAAAPARAPTIRATPPAAATGLPLAARSAPARRAATALRATIRPALAAVAPAVATTAAPAPRIGLECRGAPAPAAPGGALRTALAPARARLPSLSSPHCRSSLVGSPVTADAAGKQGSPVSAPARGPATLRTVGGAAAHHLRELFPRRDLLRRGIASSTHVFSPGIAKSRRKRASLSARERSGTRFASLGIQAPHLCPRRPCPPKRARAVDGRNRRYARISLAPAVGGAGRPGVAVPLDITPSDRKRSSNFSPVGHILRISPRHRGERSRPKLTARFFSFVGHGSGRFSARQLFGGHFASAGGRAPRRPG